MTTRDAISRPVGAVLHSARLYDAAVWLAFRGGERQFRRRVLELSRLRSGESVLDVGCGTGTLAILAKQTVGPAGMVCGVDPSAEMLVRARSKAARAGVDVRLENAAAQSLPFADSSFDLALACMMLHHLGRAGRRELVAQLRRVVKPDGRVLIVDFASSPARGRGLAGHFRHRHGHVDPSEMMALLEEAGFRGVDSGAVGIGNMHFALAASPAGAGQSSQFGQEDGPQPAECA